MLSKDKKRLIKGESQSEVDPSRWWAIPSESQKMSIGEIVEILKVRSSRLRLRAETIKRYYGGSLNHACLLCTHQLDALDVELDGDVSYNSLLLVNVNLGKVERALHRMNETHRSKSSAELEGYLWTWW